VHLSSCMAADVRLGLLQRFGRRRLTLLMLKVASFMLQLERFTERTQNPSVRAWFSTVASADWVQCPDCAVYLN